MLVETYSIFQFLDNPTIETTKKKIHTYSPPPIFQGNFGKSTGTNFINLYTENGIKDTLVISENKLHSRNKSINLLANSNYIYLYNSQLFVNHILLSQCDETYYKIESSISILFKSPKKYTFVFKTTLDQLPFTKMVYHNIKYENKSAVFLLEEDPSDEQRGIGSDILFINTKSPCLHTILSDKYVIINHSYWIHPLFVSKIEALLFHKLEVEISITTNIAYNGNILNYLPNKDYIHVLEDFNLEDYLTQKVIKLQIKPYNRNNLIILISNKVVIPFEVGEKINLPALFNYDYNETTTQAIINSISQIPIDLSIIIYFTKTTTRDLEILNVTLKYYNLWRFKVQLIIVEEGSVSSIGEIELYDCEYIFIESKSLSVGRAYNIAMNKCTQSNILFSMFDNLITELVMEPVFKFFIESKLESYHFFNKIIQYKGTELTEHLDHLLNYYNCEDYFPHSTHSNMRVFSLSSEMLLITKESFTRLSGWSNLECSTAVQYYLMDYKINKGLGRYFIGNEKIIKFRPIQEKISLTSRDAHILQQLASLEEKKTLTLPTLLSLTNDSCVLQTKMTHFLLLPTESYHFDFGEEKVVSLQGELFLNTHALRKFDETFLLSVYESFEGIKLYLNHQLCHNFKIAPVTFTTTVLESEECNHEFEYLPNQTLLNRQIETPEVVVKDYSLGQFWQFIMPTQVTLTNQETGKELYQITNTSSGIQTNNVGIVSILFNNSKSDIKEFKYHHIVIDTKDKPSLRPPLCKFIYIPSYYLSLYSVWDTIAESTVVKSKEVAYLETRNSVENNYVDLISQAFEVTTLRDTYFENMVTQLSDYRFVIIVEDYLEMGHVSEKIMAALKAGAIPLYLGSSDIETHVKIDYFMNLRNVGDENIIKEMSLLESRIKTVSANTKLNAANLLLDNRVLRAQFDYYINYYASTTA